MINMKRLLIATAGLENYAGTEEGCSFTFGGPRSTVMVPEPAGEPEFVAAFYEAVFRGLPLRQEKYDECMAASLYCLHVLAQKPAEWKRYRRASETLALQRLTR